MNKNLVRKVGEIGQDNLLAHTFPRAFVRGVKIASGEGKLPRGTILTSEGGTEYKALIEDGKANVKAILAEDVDATEAEAVAAAYFTGNFNRNAVTAKPEQEVEIDYEIEDALRHYNIILSDMQE